MPAGDELAPELLTCFFDASVGGALGVPEVFGNLPERVTLHGPVSYTHLTLPTNREV